MTLEPDIHEPLEELAAMSWRLAPTLCSADHGCGDYHRVWSTLRLLLGDSAPPWGSDDIRQAIAARARQGARRVLISGGADAGTFMVVWAAFRSVALMPDIVFIDRCATPCKQVLWLGDRLGCRVSAITADVRSLNIEPVDIVLAHNFLQFFEGEERQTVLQAWARNLVSGGSLLLSQRLVMQDAEPHSLSDFAHIKALQPQLAAKGLEHGFSAAEAAELVAAAGRFWEAPRGATGMTQGALRQGLGDAGFVIQVMEESAARLPQGPRAMTAAQNRTAQRFHIEAVYQACARASDGNTQPHGNQVASR